MNVAVVGTGNVGSALLMHLTEVENISQVMVMNLQDDWSKAAIMDAASAGPYPVARLYQTASFRELGRADLIVLTSGVQMKKDETDEDVVDRNLELTHNILDQCELKNDARIICLATPVDRITPFVYSQYKRPKCKVIGFGGDLDRNRLEYILQRRGITSSSVNIIGEHGKNAIPVYKSEEEYDAVTKQVRHFLANITAQGGNPRNLATGWLLAKLIDSIVNDRKQIHHVCGFHSKFQTFLTWPFIIGREGLINPIELSLPTQADLSFQQLLKTHPAETN